ARRPGARGLVLAPSVRVPRLAAAGAPATRGRLQTLRPDRRELTMDDRVAFVTGGAGGIGRATCQAFHDAGYRVALTDLAADAPAAAAAEIDPAGESVVGIVCDVSSTPSVDAAVAAAVERFGRLDSLANVAGVVGPGPSEELSDESWDRLISIHLGGAFRCSRAAVPPLSATGAGPILT